MEQIETIKFFNALGDKIKRILDTNVVLSSNGYNSVFLTIKGTETWPILELTLMFKYESDFISLGSTPNFKFNSVTASMRPEQEKLLLSASSTKDIKPLCRTINKFLEKSDPKYNKKDNSCKVHLNDYWLTVFLEDIEMDAVFVNWKRKDKATILLENLNDALFHFDYNKNSVDEIYDGIIDILWENVDQFDYSVMPKIWEDALKKLLDYTKNKLTDVDY